MLYSDAGGNGSALDEATRTAINDYNNRINTNQAKVNQLTQEVKAKEKELEKYKNALENINTAIETLTQANSQINSLQGEISKAYKSNVNNSLNVAIRSIEPNGDGLSINNAQSEILKKIKELEKEIKEIKEKIERLNKEIDNWRYQISYLLKYGSAPVIG